MGLRERGGGPLDYQMIWRFPTTIHAKFLDFCSTSVFWRDPEAGLDPLVIEGDVRRNLRRFVPQRILVRFHDRSETGFDRGCS